MDNLSDNWPETSLNIRTTACTHTSTERLKSDSQSVENVGGPAMLFGLLGSLALVVVALSLRRKAIGCAGDDDAEPTVLG